MKCVINYNETITIQKGISEIYPFPYNFSVFYLDFEIKSLKCKILNMLTEILASLTN